jgi:glycosyltransferase involved in cell wall biosynthesis
LVLAANSGALPELIADAGLLFTEGDTDQLAAILTDLIYYPSKYQAYQEKALQRAHQYLSINTQGAMLYAAFKPSLQAL